jgi:hypothetical protein
MKELIEEDQAHFEAALGALQRGDFSLLDPLFTGSASETPAVLRWYGQGRFESHPKELAEALTCACFLGALDVAEQMLVRGVAPSGGDGTGLNAFHWAANRGQVGAVRLLLRHGAPLEVRNAYGGTVLGAAVWAAVHESKPAHLEVIEELLRAGANIAEAEYPTGLLNVDALLQRYGARGGA